MKTRQGNSHWSKLTSVEQKQYLQRWLRDTKKRTSRLSIRRHILRHAKEIKTKNPAEWSASMHNLLDQHDLVFGIKDITTLRLNKLEKKYWKNTKRYSPPPPIPDRRRGAEE